MNKLPADLLTFTEEMLKRKLHFLVLFVVRYWPDEVLYCWVLRIELYFLQSTYFHIRSTFKINLTRINFMYCIYVQKRSQYP